MLKMTLMKLARASGYRRDAHSQPLSHLALVIPTRSSLMISSLRGSFLKLHRRKKRLQELGGISSGFQTEKRIG